MKNPMNRVPVSARSVLVLVTASLLSLSVQAANLTRDNGAAVGDNQNSQTAGANGPVLLQDVQLIQKLQRFDRERIPERVVHARGTGNVQRSFDVLLIGLHHVAQHGGAVGNPLIGERDRVRGRLIGFPGGVVCGAVGLPNGGELGIRCTTCADNP